MNKRGCSIIFPEAHAIIAKNLCKDINENYNINLNEKKMIWGAISPDILPKYKIYRHYKEDSEEFLVNEIVNLIYICRFFNLKSLDNFKKKIISIKIGVISHFLSDYVCLPHKENWTFNEAFKKHVNYEKELNEVVKDHIFEKDIISTEKISLYECETIHLKKLVKEYINKVIDEYSLEQSYERDLNFALNLSTNISYFIFDVVNELNHEISMDYSFVF
ncbi:MAG: zinc dependent phospholipase C family protein [Miniphocaeibacter sp.]|uniref:zinc dependent phospholipase C family protein n=1 Tax=Miniphocaeibacter sp. TaxID=3100973 RepID=UPI003BB06F23